MKDPLAPLRRRLTAWYIGVFALVLALFGVGLFLFATREISADLDRSLERTAEEVVRAARIREREAVEARGTVVDAMDELHIPGRALYLLDREGRPVYPREAEPWIRVAAQRAIATGAAHTTHEGGADQTWRLYARRFELSGGQPYAAVALADVVEVENRYRHLIIGFALAGAVSLALVAAGGMGLARRAARPVDDTFRQMRRFLADAAHELRTPLSILRSQAEIALAPSRPVEDHADALRSIAREAERMGGIVENMLLLARSDAGGWPVRRDPLYLDDLLQDAVSAATALGEGKGVQVMVSELDEAPMNGDESLIRQLLLIVLHNAVKFSRQGAQVTAAVRCEGGRCRVEIADAGPGIPPEELPHVFERFYRGDSARGRASGAGLGLSIARWIVDVHDGSINLDSRPGEGTRVRLDFARRPTSRPL